MKKRVNIDKLSDIITIMISKLDDIEKTKSELQKNIEYITDYYKDSYANKIKEKYLNDLNNLNKITETIQKYINYFKWLTESYQNNLNNTIHNLQLNIKNSSNKSFDNLATINLNNEI